MPETRAPLVLASASSYKRKLLARLGLDFSSIEPEIEEDRLPEEAPRQMAIRLAREKALAAGSLHPDAFIIGADQVIALEGWIFQKPGDAETAIEQLLALQGATHSLITAVALRTPDEKILTDQVSFQMEMRPLSRREISAYVHEDRPLDCAGSYKIEAAGIRLFRNTIGPDPSAIEGLPLTRIWALLEKGGYFS